MTSDKSTPSEPLLFSSVDASTVLGGSEVTWNHGCQGILAAANCCLCQALDLRFHWLFLNQSLQVHSLTIQLGLKVGSGNQTNAHELASKQPSVNPATGINLHASTDRQLTTE